MGSKFIQKHKRKGALASLLLLLRSRAKYFVILLLVVGTATPFIATRENVSTLMQFAPVASFLKFTGLSNVFLNTNSDGSYSAKDLKSAFARAEAYDKGSSFWRRLLNKMSSNTPGTHSSIAMLRGTDILKEEAEGGRRKAKGKGGANNKDYASGKNGRVDVDGMVPDVAGMMEKNGMLGNIMGANLADRHSGSAGYGGAQPYMNKDLMAMNGGAADKYAGKYDNVLNKTNKIPLAGKPTKIKKRKMGKASGFAWRNAGYKTKKANMDTRINSNKRAMFQLAETYAMSTSVTSDAAPEYQASYVGSTYDGNDANADLLDTDDGGSTEVPDTAFTGGLLTGIGDLQQVAKECTESQANEGAEMSRLSKEMDTGAKNMGGAPKCYDHGAVDNWNNKVRSQKALCLEFNANAAVLSAKCQGEGQQMNCGSTYDGQIISKCHKPSKWFRWIIAFALAIMAVIAFVFGQPWLAALLLMVAAYVYMSGSGGGGGGSGGPEAHNKKLSDDASQGDFDDDGKVIRKKDDAE